jgi:hypothetical protein
MIMLSACAADPLSSVEYQALEDDLVATQQQLDTLVLERDELAAEIAIGTSRHDLAAANQEAVAAIIADPAAYGSEEDTLDLLMEYATSDAVMDDVALGSIGMRSAWRETIFWTDSDIETFATWIADDGSSGGSLWVWRGLAANGETFELVGVNIDTYDHDGRITYEKVFWPYPDMYVDQVIQDGTSRP